MRNMMDILLAGGILGRGGMLPDPEVLMRMISQATQGDIPFIGTCEDGKREFVLPLPTPPEVRELMKINAALTSAKTRLAGKEEEMAGWELISKGKPAGMKKLCPKCQQGFRQQLQRDAGKMLDEKGITVAIRKIPRNPALKNQLDTVVEVFASLKAELKNLEKQLAEISKSVPLELRELTEPLRISIPFGELRAAITSYQHAKAEAEAAKREETPD